MAASSPHSSWPLHDKPSQASPIDTVDAAKRESRGDDPFHRFYRGPLGRMLARGLARTNVRPAHVSFAQPFLGAIAGYLLTFADARHLIAGALVFEGRSILGSIADALARAKGLTSDRDLGDVPAANRLSAAFFYAGIAWHFHLHGAPASGPSAHLALTLVLALSLLQAWVRDLAFEHYSQRLGALPSVERDAAPARWLRLIWSVSGVETCSSLLVVALLVGRLWMAQVFFATAGVLWIAAAILVSRWLFARHSPRLAPA